MFVVLGELGKARLEGRRHGLERSQDAPEVDATDHQEQARDTTQRHQAVAVPEEDDHEQRQKERTEAQAEERDQHHNEHGDHLLSGDLEVGREELESVMGDGHDQPGETPQRP